ncbi:cytochrome P450 4c3-like isoform X2 [Daphnia pulex]|uniref:cytochrome P450 4c3-like isoform X2 n=1 Tax=Daphnia pulex TaxID=6669 RepID=UPI001EE035FD|nr:cytochrome P450 4c3-like isoform X2 [Daphnia pulex]XP_046448963.1 cytochrome P450 4c3-like isoform X2 [Daphnia pulex]
MSPTLLETNSLWTGWGDWFPPMWLLLVTTLVFYYWTWSQSRVVRLINAIPGPKSLPLLGNLLDLDVYNDNFLKMTTIDWVQKYGPMYRVWLCTRPFIALSSPELVQKILASTKLITKSPDYSNFSSWLGNCMFTSTGVHWKNRRRLVTPGFHFQNHTSFIDIFNEKSAECAREFERTIETHGDVEIDVNPFMAKCALNIICETAMGQQTKIEVEKAIYVNNVHRICQIFVERVSRPWLSIDWIYKLSSLGRESQKCISSLHAFTNKVTRDRREMLKEEEQDRGNVQNKVMDVEKESKRRFAFVDGLIKASNEGADLNDNGIREEIDLITFAGYDTTSAAMVWFLYLIAKHPEHQKLILDELDVVFCGDVERPCTTQDIAELKYLECCIKEALRMYPSIPFVMRNLTEDVEIDGHTLPAGVTVAMVFYAIHHNPLIYPDPEVFRPERFFPENSVGRHPYAFIPFSAGPRNCIGQKYAMLELKVVFANLLRKVKFSVPDPTKPLSDAPDLGFVLKPKHGVRLNLSKRLNKD